jgi:hypothetical protein
MSVNKPTNLGGGPWWLCLLCVLFIGCSTPRTNEPPAKWTSLNAGMTRQELTSLLGPPSGHSGVNGDLWRSKGWQLQVDYDKNGRARNILRSPAY